MARYRIEEEPQGVAIEVSGVSGHQQELLEAFEECRSGHCTCPTEEYQKVAGMDIAATEGDISLHLEAKPGTRVDTEEISACLDYTTSKVQGSEREYPSR